MTSPRSTSSTSPPTARATHPDQGGIELGPDARAQQVAGGGRGAYFSDEKVSGSHLRVLTAPLGAGTAIQVARPLGEVDSLLDRLRAVLLRGERRGRGDGGPPRVGHLGPRAAPGDALHGADRGHRRGRGPAAPARRRGGRRAGPAGRLLQHHPGRAPALRGVAAPARGRRVARAAHPPRQPAHERRGAAARRRAVGLRPRRSAERPGDPDRRAHEPRRGRGRHRAPGRARRRSPGGAPGPARGGRPRPGPPARAPRRADAAPGALGGERIPRAAGAAGGQPRGQRRQVEPPGRRRRGDAWRPASSRCATTGRASPPPTSRSSSTASTGRRRPGACPGPAWAWRSCARWPRPTAPSRRPRTPRAAAPACGSRSRASP